MKNEKTFSYLSTLMCVYCVFTAMQNLFEMKTVGTPEFALCGGGLLLSWATFLVMDTITEVYGKQRAIRCYTLAGILNLVVVLISQLLILLPGTYPEQNAAFAQIFSNGVRTAVASFIAFLIGNYINVDIMVKLKTKAGSKDSKPLFFVRAVVSTILGQFVDNLLFVAIAFAPVGISAFEMTWTDIFTASASGMVLETLVEMLFIPIITIPLAKYLESKVEN